MQYMDIGGLNSTNLNSAYGQNSYVEHYARIESAALRDACLAQDFPNMLGALGLKGEFVPFPEVEPPALQGAAASDEWHGLYVEEDVRSMHLVANHPSGLALALTPRILRRPPLAELGARIFLPTRKG